MLNVDHILKYFPKHYAEIEADFYCYSLGKGQILCQGVPSMQCSAVWCSVVLGCEVFVLNSGSGLDQEALSSISADISNNTKCIYYKGSRARGLK